MQDYTFCDGDSIKQEFPEPIHINKDILYEIEFNIIRDSNPSSFSCVYKVSYIKPVSSLIESINYIVNMFNDMHPTITFEKWFREHYKLQVIK